MNKSELINRILAIYPYMERDDAHKIVDIFINSVIYILLDGGHAEFRGFGTFSVRTRREYSTINPLSGKRMDLSKKYTVHFRASKQLNDTINDKGDLK